MPTHSHSHSHSQSQAHPPHSHSHSRHPRTRSRSGSLSIARSPSVLSAGTIFAPLPSPLSGPISPLHDLESGSSDVDVAQAVSSGVGIGFVPPVSGVGAGVVAGAEGISSPTHLGYGLRRVVSGSGGRHGPSTLTPIESVDDLTAIRSKDDMDLEHRSETERRYVNQQQQQYQHHQRDHQYGQKATDDAHYPTSDPHPFEPEETHAADLPLLHALPKTKTKTKTRTSDDSAFSVPLSLSLSDMEERQDQGSYDGPFQPPDSKELLGILASVSAVCVLAFAAGLTTVFDWVL